MSCPEKDNISTTKNILAHPISSIKNPSGFKILILFSMAYMVIMLCNAVLTNRYVGSDEFFILGGTLTSPFIFILNDIIAEVYGYQIGKFIIYCGFGLQFSFTIICQAILLAPAPSFFVHQAVYSQILGLSLLHITISGFIAYLIATLVNSYIITQWKILVKGRRFWLRSFASSTFSEALYSFIAILMMEFMSLPLASMLRVIFLSYLIKATYSLIFAAPAQLLVNHIKKITGIDVFDTPQKFAPFAIFKKTRIKYD